jgi:hypothetical protein
LAQIILKTCYTVATPVGLSGRTALHLRKVMVDDAVAEDQIPEIPLATPETPVTPVEEEEQEEPEAPPSKPALVINIQSWATPIVGLVMLLLGLALGYIGRPLVSPQNTPSPAAAANVPTQTSSSPASAVSTPTLMEYLITQTRHFKGDPSAPVTFIEFSDYQ